MDINTLFLIVLLIIILFFFSTISITVGSGDVVISGNPTINTLTTSSPSSVDQSTSSLLDSNSTVTLQGIQNKFYYNNMRYIPI